MKDKCTSKNIRQRPSQPSLIIAAGGNGTVIETIDQPLSRRSYEFRGKALVDNFEPHNAEQAGFLIINDNHFEMAGGEFCGNATRSAAVLLYLEYGEDAILFTVSGFNGVVNASVRSLARTKFFVETTFPEMQTRVEKITLEDNSAASTVDLGGIVHIVIEGKFPTNPDEYSARHRRIVDQLGLNERDAVGVIWYEKLGNTIEMHPVVWVRAINSFFYESSCGSGAIAVGKVTGGPSVIQPSGMAISVNITSNSVVLGSEMEVIY